MKTLEEILKEEHAALKTEAIGDDQNLTAIHHKRNTARYVALCLSGGGIRSATFNLGLLQGLARPLNKLGDVDYLSTVSGGGFIGSWYSAWKYRDNNKTPDLNEDLEKLTQPKFKDPVQVEPKPVEHLRSFGNYLSPTVGLLSADFWTLVALYARNVCLINMVLVPVILAALMIPRILYAWMNLTFEAGFWTEFFLAGVFGVGVVTGAYAVWRIGQNLPKIGTKNDDEIAYIKWIQIPLAISTFCFVSFWAWYCMSGTKPDAVKPQVFKLTAAYLPWAVGIVGVALLFVPFLATFGLKSIKALVLLLLSTGVMIAVTYYSLTHTLLFGARTYVTLAFPFLFFLLMAGGTLVAGLTSRFTNDAVEEWWARSGAWMMIVMLGWITICVLVLWAPSVILRSIALLMSPSELVASWKNLATLLGPLVGVLSTILSLAGGFTSATPATGDKQSSVGTTSWIVANATSLFASIALVFILATLAALTGPLLLVANVAGGASLRWNEHAAILANSSLGGLILAAAIMFAAAQVFAWFVDTNKFSLHYFWRNRIVRAYLGASRDHEKTHTTVEFTRFDPEDNLRMSDLGTQRPFHVINIALNLVGSKKLNWQERMAESFTVSPLHCGTHWLGYRDSSEYAEGISLGNAVAISGAAASPNMGYMMTSPVVRFLMTMFNVRLGSWMGNPGPAGNTTYTHHAPANILRPILSEALGQTNDESPYVYLSDGGHFENLGLYEMVLRRCRYIIVSDASTDAKYTYESLAQATRKIRIDFGVPIDFHPFPLMGRTQDGSGVHCAVGTIGYSQADPTCQDGVLLYIKPSLVKDEPRDIINYLSESGDFPQESIADQFFSESQFESYRMLGLVIAQRLFKSETLVADLEAFQSQQAKAAAAKA